MDTADIPCPENVIADYESIKIYKDAEWMLNPGMAPNGTDVFDSCYNVSVLLRLTGLSLKMRNGNKAPKM